MPTTTQTASQLRNARRVRSTFWRIVGKAATLTKDGGASRSPGERANCRRSQQNAGDNSSGAAAEPQEEIAMKGAQKPKKGDKKPAQKTLKEKRQDKRNAAKGNSGLS